MGTASGCAREHCWPIWVWDAPVCCQPPQLCDRQCGTAQQLLGFLHNMGQETGLSQIISQHSLSEFPGCFPGLFCYAVKVLRACDRGDKTHHDAGAARHSRLCANKKTGQHCSVVSTGVQGMEKGKWGFPGQRPGCQVSHLLPLTSSAKGGEPLAALLSTHPDSELCLQGER